VVGTVGKVDPKCRQPYHDYAPRDEDTEPPRTRSEGRVIPRPSLGERARAAISATARCARPTRAALECL